MHIIILLNEDCLYIVAPLVNAVLKDTREDTREDISRGYQGGYHGGYQGDCADCDRQSC